MSTRERSIAWIVGVLCLASIAEGAPNMRIGTLTFSGDVNAGQRDMVRSKLQQGLEASGAELCVADTTTPVSAAPECIWTVDGNVAGKDRTYAIELWIVDQAGGRFSEHTDSCEICGLKALGDAVALSASTLFADFQRKLHSFATLKISSGDVAAQVDIDGEAHGQTPMEISVRPGRRQVRFHGDRYWPSEEEIVLAPAAHEALTLTREMGPPRALSWSRQVGWISAVSGLAAIVAGTVLLAIDGSESGCSGSGPIAQCESRLNTDLAGWMLTGAGIAATAAGGYFLYRGYIQYRGTWIVVRF